MKDKIKVLHLEDSPRDAEMIHNRLAAGELVCDVLRVANREGFESALNGEAFDVILCDYNLPDYDGITALIAARHRHPLTPVLLISGTLGEEDAVKCLQHGGTDYLLKDKLERLPAAVRRAMGEAEERRKREQAEADLRDSEAILRSFFDSAGGMRGIVDLAGEEVLHISDNAVAAIFYGQTKETMRRKRDLELGMPEPIRQLWVDRLRESERTAAPVCFDCTWQRLGEDQWLFVTVSHLGSSPEGNARFAYLVQDVSERRRAEAALRESEERFRQLAECSSEGFWFFRVNPPGCLYVSPALERIWGVPASRFYQDRRCWMAAIHPEDQAHTLEQWDACLQGRSPRFEAEYRVVRPDGSVRWVLDAGTPIRDAAGEIVRLSGVARDITERKHVETQMLRTQRLESIGTLASGVAHDVNNALAPILMATELLRMASVDEAPQYLDLIQNSAKRAANMMKQLLTFAKGAEGERVLLQPRHLLREMEKLIRGTFPKNIELRVSCPKDLWTVLGDSTQLHQVLLNLCVNARDAMPDGGTLTLKAENLELDAVYASTVPEARPGRHVVWRVIDTGTGIPPEILDRIFEPFFSTKGPEKGTGLGLSTVVGIVKSHGGFIRVYSPRGQGSTFVVHLPAASSSGGDTSLLNKEQITFRGNGETILVVDDEAAVREVTRNMLTALNFKVLLASSGTAALVQAAEHRKSLAALITDMHMPGMDGLAFVRVLNHMLPETKIIVASGRLDEREAGAFKTLGVSSQLEKPFSLEQLVAALRAVFPK